MHAIFYSHIYKSQYKPQSYFVAWLSQKPTNPLLILTPNPHWLSLTTSSHHYNTRKWTWGCLGGFYKHIRLERHVAKIMFTQHSAALKTRTPASVDPGIVTTWWMPCSIAKLIRDKWSCFYFVYDVSQWYLQIPGKLLLHSRLFRLYFVFCHFVL